MKQIILQVGPNHSADFLEAELSFEPFYDFVKERLADERTIRHELFELVMNRLNEYPDINTPLKPEDTSNYVPVLESIYATLTTATSDKKEALWALSIPMQPTLFYVSDTMMQVVADKHKEEANPLVAEHIKENERRRIFMLYSAILERFYGYRLTSKKEMLYYYTNPETGMLKCYDIKLDDRFEQIIAKEKLPELNFRKIERHVQADTHLEYLMKVLPLKYFKVKGFGIITLTDITEEYVIESIKTSIIDTATKPKEKCVSDIKIALNTLVGTNKIDFGFIPLALLNNKPLLDFASFSNSVLLNYGKGKIIPEDAFLEMVNEYIKKPFPVFLKEVDKYHRTNVALVKVLQSANVASYALMPLMYNNQLTGVMEVYVNEPGLLSEKTLLRLDTVLPYLAQLMKTTVEDFNQKIALLVNDKFTALQSSVLWKFNEAAFNYMRNRIMLQREPEMEGIVFKEVYPIYGAIDIRNSSAERNNAAREDYLYSLNLLSETFTQLREKNPLGLMDEMIFKTRRWKNAVQESLTTTEEFKLNTFMENEAIPFLKHLKKVNPASASHIHAYMEALDTKTGKAHESRRNFENSMHLINRSISNYFDEKKNFLQQLYPCYFEKIRTDGIEYDIYIGQSIAPDKPFDLIYLRNLRLWQLQSMAEIYKLVQGLQPQLSRTLTITQLIFINANTIDVSFRNDEKRFDVEGGYNIRYQVIKKRIDKVRIKDTGERLTQPGKIAMVYYNDKEAEEYESYISYLQEQHIFDNDLEYLELEQLQGVAGLKALRVSLCTD